MTSSSFVATASQTEFVIGFPFLSAAHIVVEVDGVATTSFTVSGTTLTLSAPLLTGGEEVVLSRRTPIDQPLAQFANGSSLRASEMNRAILQILYNLQEAETLANAGLLKNGGGTAWNAESLPMRSLGTPVNLTDAATKAYVDALASESGILPSPVGQNGKGLIVTSDVLQYQDISGALQVFKLPPQTETVVGQVGGFVCPVEGGGVSLTSTDWTRSSTKIPLAADFNVGTFSGGTVSLAGSDILLPVGKYLVEVTGTLRSLTSSPGTFSTQLQGFSALTDDTGATIHDETSFISLGLSGGSTEEEFQSSCSFRLFTYLDFSTPTKICGRGARVAGSENVVIDQGYKIIIREVIR